jgi:predicted ribosomally synthesized peptide with SipW-like signal peptide
MKQLLIVTLVVVLVIAVGGSLVNGTFASFFDTEVSSGNQFHAGTRSLEISGNPVTVTCGIPSKWYSEEYTLLNTGDLDGVAVIHIPEESLLCIEAGTVGGLVWNGSAYVAGTPVGANVASSEPELVSEEGGQVGQITVTGLGVEAGADTVPPDDWVMSKHADIKVWYDEDGDGVFSDDELIVSDKLFNVACNEYELGVIPAAESLETQGGGWGSYFTYNIGGQAVELPLMMGQFSQAGTVTVWNDATHLYVHYDTTDSGWEMALTQVYIGTDPPPKLAPGEFPYKHDPVPLPQTEDLYQIPLDGLSGEIYIATHTEGTDGETGWAMSEGRKVKIVVHLQQVEDPSWPVDYDHDGDIDEDDEQKKWWPTNVFQGDRCTFDIEFTLIEDDP